MIRFRLSNILEERHLQNKTEVAEMVGLTRWALSKLTLYKRERIEFLTIEKLCRGLNVTPNELFEIRNVDGTLWYPKKEKNDAPSEEIPA